MDVKTQLQTILQLLKQEEQELIHMKNKMVKKRWNEKLKLKVANFETN